MKRKNRNPKKQDAVEEEPACWTWDGRSPKPCEQEKADLEKPATDPNKPRTSNPDENGAQTQASQKRKIERKRNTRKQTNQHRRKAPQRKRKQGDGSEQMQGEMRIG